MGQKWIQGTYIDVLGRTQFGDSNCIHTILDLFKVILCIQLESPKNVFYCTTGGLSIFLDLFKVTFKLVPLQITIKRSTSWENIFGTFSEHPNKQIQAEKKDEDIPLMEEIRRSPPGM